MRRVTRNLVLTLLAVGAGLLAVGALPASLQAGDPYYLTATAVDADRPTVNASALSGERYQYTVGALTAAPAPETGHSRPYWKGPLGLKEVFTHSPFDELEALREQYPNATGPNGAVYARWNGTTYRLTITRATDAA